MADGSTEGPNQTQYWNQAKRSTSGNKEVFHSICVGWMETGGGGGKREQE